MNITLEPHSEYSPYGSMAFSANWSDDTHRYHVWLGLRENDKATGEPVPYPVAVEPTIYKNSLSDRMANTIKMSLDAKANAKIKAEIKRIAKRETLLALFEARKAAHAAHDAMRAEADRLNAIFDAIKLLETATSAEFESVGYLPEIRFPIYRGQTVTR